MSVWTIGDWVLVALAVVFFIYFLGHALSAEASRFPKLIYGSVAVEGGRLRLGWVVLLLVCAGVGHTAPWVATSSSVTASVSSQLGQEMLAAEALSSEPVSYRHARGVYLHRAVELRAGSVTETKQVRIPVLFLAGLVLYWFMVIGWRPPLTNFGDSQGI